MSLQDDYFDLKDWMKNKPKWVQKSFDNIWDYSIQAEEEIDKIRDQNCAMRKVIKIIK